MNLGSTISCVKPCVAFSVFYKTRRQRLTFRVGACILQVNPTIIITSQLIDVGTGSVLTSQRINGDKGDKIFSLIDRLSRVVKNDLSLPPEALTEPDPQVADVTTSSVDAYRHYLEGMENRFKQYDNEAEKSFRKALEFDSTLAMAYFWLVDYTFGEEQEKFKNKAKRMGLVKPDHWPARNTWNPLI